MAYVKIEDGWAVGTDGHRLHCAALDAVDGYYTAGGEYIGAELPDGLRFPPNWKAVIPDPRRAVRHVNYAGMIAETWERYDLLRSEGDPSWRVQSRYMRDAMCYHGGDNAAITISDKKSAARIDFTDGAVAVVMPFLN